MTPTFPIQPPPCSLRPMQIEEHSGAKAVGLASLRCAASAASAVVAVAATSAERFPQVGGWWLFRLQRGPLPQLKPYSLPTAPFPALQINSGHMRNGCVLMLAWDLLSSMHMAMPAGTLLQVGLSIHSMVRCTHAVRFPAPP